jgi:hypothetical protein
MDKNYNYEENGYTFLGWQNGWKHVYLDIDKNVTEDKSKQVYFDYLTEDYPEYGKCRDLKHQTVKVHHNNRGTENTVSCPICMIYWKYDSSD